MKPKITIGICTGGTIRAETVVSLVSNMINVAQTGLMADLLVQVGGYVDVNRNKIVETAITNGSTHIMFIDADMVFPDDGVMRLFKQDKDIVGANYNVRLDPTSPDLSGPTVKMLEKGEVVSMINKDFPTELFECYAVATGFMMIKASVFDELQKPWFKSSIGADGTHTTEDIQFCQRANSVGVKIFCDPTIKMGHIGSYLY